MAKNTDELNANAEKNGDKEKGVNANAEKNGDKEKVNIPKEIIDLEGKQIIINEVTKKAQVLSNFNAKIVYENMCISHGAKNVRMLRVCKENFSEVLTICKKYKNSILKA